MKEIKCDFCGKSDKKENIETYKMVIFKDLDMVLKNDIIAYKNVDICDTCKEKLKSESCIFKYGPEEYMKEKVNKLTEIIKEEEL